MTVRAIANQNRVYSTNADLQGISPENQKNVDIQSLTASLSAAIQQAPVSRVSTPYMGRHSSKPQPADFIYALKTTGTEPGDAKARGEGHNSGGDESHDEFESAHSEDSAISNAADNVPGDDPDHIDPVPNPNPDPNPGANLDDPKSEENRPWDVWDVLGKMFSIPYSLGCGLATMAAFWSFFAIAAINTWVLLGGFTLFICGAVVNWKISWWSAPDFLRDVFAGESLFEGLTTYKKKFQDGRELKYTFSTKQKIAFAIGAFFAACSGAAWASLAYGGALGSLEVVATVFGSSPAFTWLPGAVAVLSSPIAWVLVIATFICINAMNIKEVADYIGIKEIHKSALFIYMTERFSKEYHFDHLSYDEQAHYGHSDNLSWWAVVPQALGGLLVDMAYKIVTLYPIRMLYTSEYFFKGLSDADKAAYDNNPDNVPIWKRAVYGTAALILVPGIIALCLFGQIMVLTTAGKDLNKLIMSIWDKAPQITQAVSNVICLGLALLGELPFLISTALSTAWSIIRPGKPVLRTAQGAGDSSEASKGSGKYADGTGPDGDADSLKETTGDQVLKVLYLICRIGNGIGVGGIAAREATTAGMQVASGLAQSITSICAGAAGDQDEELGHAEDESRVPPPMMGR